MSPGARGAVLVTGSSSGIGEACAQHLHGLGYTVLAGVRREADGERLRERLGPRLVPLILDVADADSIAAARDQAEGELAPGGLAGLVNNAGVAAPGPLEFIPIDDLRHQLEVNTVGQIAVTQAFLSAIRQARGRVINIGSIGGRISTGFMGPYHASKHAMEALSDALRQELAPWGIEVALIEPGSVATPIWDKGQEGADEDLEKLGPEGRRLYERSLHQFAAVTRDIASRGVAPASVAEAVEHALTARRPRTRYLVGRDARVMAVARVLLPDRVLDRIVARRLRSAG